MAPKPKDDPPPIVLAKLGINEAYQLAMYLVDQYRGTSLSCRYTIPSHLASPAAQPQLRQAVTFAVVDTIQRHPLLQVGILAATSNKPSWIQLPQLDLNNHICWVELTDPSTLEQVTSTTFATQLDEKFPSDFDKRPDWKFTLIHSPYSPQLEIILTWNHPWFDATGAKIIHEDLLTFLSSQPITPTSTTTSDQQQTHPNINLTTQILTLPLTPSPILPVPIERQTKFPVSTKYLLKTLWEDIRPQSLNRDKSQAFWAPIPSPSAPYKTQFRSFHVPQGSLEGVLRQCRANNTTITALLHGLALLSFSARLNQKEAAGFQCSTVIDHRRNLPNDKDGMASSSTSSSSSSKRKDNKTTAIPAGNHEPKPSSRLVANYVSQHPHRFPPDLVARIRFKLSPSSQTSSSAPSDSSVPAELSEDMFKELWSVAAQTRKEIVKRLDDGVKDDIVGVFKYVHDWQSTMKGAAKRKRQFSWLVTNIGVVDGETPAVQSADDDGRREKWEITRAMFGLSAEIPMAAIEFSPVSVRGHGMVVGASWADVGVDEMLAEGIVGDLERWLGQIARED